MSIALHELPAAVETYLTNFVHCTVSPITPDSQSHMNSNELGTFGVTVTNADEPNGVRLTNVKHHLKVVNGLLVVPASPVARATTDPDDPALAVGLQVPEYFLFPSDNVLDVPDSNTIAGLRVRALQEGPMTITDHIHASLSFGDVFPISNSKSGEQTITVV